MVPYILVQATANDFQSIYDLKKVAYREYVEQTWGWDEDFQMKFHQLNFSPANTKMIVVEGKLIGTIDVNEDNEKMFISALYLLPEYQNQGIGTAIIKEVIAKAKARRKLLQLEVLKVNINAQQLYQRLGFTMKDADKTKILMFINFQTTACSQQ